MTMDRYNFPVTHSLGNKTSLTYASVTGSILKKIKEGKHGELHGKPICPPDGQFQLILKPAPDSGLEGKVMLQFSYRNLYLEAFSTGEEWYRFSDNHQDIVPGRVSHPLPFESGYTNRGMAPDFSSLTFGVNTMGNIFKVLSAYPNNPGGVAEVKIALAKVCVLFSEAIRFPKLRRFLVYLLRCVDTQTVKTYAANFQDWSSFCEAISEGEEAFDATEFGGVNTFEELLSLVAVILHTV